MATGSERYTTRPFAMGTFTFTVTTSTADDRALVESLFRDMPEPASAGTGITAFTMLRSSADRSAWAVSGQRLDDVTVSTIESALSLLMGEVNFNALDAEPESLHLHAALATNEGRAVVIAAQRDTGKTTTVAHLMARGWGFVTDENVRLSPGAVDVTGFPKPLSIKPGGRELVVHLQPWMIPPVGDGPEDFRFVPVSASGATVVEGGVPHVVVLLRRPFPRNQVGSPVAERLHPADAVVALMQETLDAERFGSAAARLATLAAASHCYELTAGTPEATVDEIEQLFRLDPVEPEEVAVLPSSPAFSPGVVSVTIGDRVVIHDTVSGRILALDAGGTRVWRQLGGWCDDDGIDVDGPVIGPFVAQLRELGVVAGAA
jgi:hypothetical protein